jgi:hypothetical protein
MTYQAVSRLTETGWPVVAASVVGLFFHFGSLLVVTFSFFIKPRVTGLNVGRFADSGVWRGAKFPTV